MAERMWLYPDEGPTPMPEPADLVELADPAGLVGQFLVGTVTANDDGSHTISLIPDPENREV